MVYYGIMKDNATKIHVTFSINRLL